MNPLLDFSGLPRYAEVLPEHVGPAIEQLLAQARTAVQQAEGAPATWESFVAPLDDANERLARAWAVVAHLHAVVDTPPLRAAYNAQLPAVTAYWTELGQNERLYAQYRALAASPAFAALSRARRRVVENALRDYRLAGVELAAAAKARFGAIQRELASLSARFGENVLDATDGYALYIEDERRLAGIPAEELAAAREAAQKDGRAGFKFSLHMPSWLPVMQYAEDRSLRAELYRASATRASEFGPRERDNGPVMARILALRAEAARLLGYANHAQVSLVPKMASSPEEVLRFLRDLAARARPFAEREARQLREFARRELGIDRLEAWDVAFASERLRRAHYAFSEQEVKPYLPETRVLPGIFRLVEALFGVRLRERTGGDAPSRWHPEVRFFELEDGRGEPLGGLYVDLYARPGKRPGAWMDEVIVRRRRAGTLQRPVAVLVCNLARPVGGRPALFAHEDALTILHELGHGLHMLLTRQEELGVSGLSGVEWDAVELPSQFLENFGWEWDVLVAMSGHVDTGEALPRELFERMRRARHFQTGLSMLRQIEYALFDMRLHSDYDAEGERTVLALLEEVRDEVAVLRPPEWSRFPHTFSHIFAGGYAAGYYSYKWAEVLSADAYAAFEEAGVLDARTGARFRDEILAPGGSRPAAESFRAFRGREPSLEALLRHSGMIAT